MGISLLDIKHRVEMLQIKYDEQINETKRALIQLQQRKGLRTMRNWFNNQEFFIRWNTPSLGNIYNADLVAYMDRMYQSGWVKEDKDALNEIRQLYLINKDNLNLFPLQLILK